MDLVRKFIDNPNEDLIIKSKNCLSSKEVVMMGIDEAGRGPVLGPMVYAAAFYPVEEEEIMKEKNFADSKTLSENERETIFESIEKDCKIGWVARIISPNTISTSFYRREKYNLNELSHDAATQLANEVISTGVKIEKLFVDTVGKPDKYVAKLKKRLPNIKEIRVESKADAKFPVVSAASIVAKVLRDACLNNWKFPENEDFLQITHVNFGCGYPSDSTTTSFLRKCFNPIFGFPSFIRFNWSTASNILDSKGYSVTLYEGLQHPTQSHASNDATCTGKNEVGKRKIAITNYFTPVAKKAKTEEVGSRDIVKKSFYLTQVTSLEQLFK